VSTLVYCILDDLLSAVTKRRLVEATNEDDPSISGEIDTSKVDAAIAAAGDLIDGYVGKRYLEVLQTGHHLLFDRYFAYSSPRLLRAGRSAVLFGSAFDPGSRKAAKNYIKSAIATPSELLKPVHFQSIVIIQPIDTMADGATNMCDGCPDMTVHKGELVWSCRLDERLQYGCLLQPIPKSKSTAVGNHRLRMVPSDGEELG